MKILNLLFVILISSIIFISCNSVDSEKQNVIDSLKVAEQNKTEQIKKEKNEYLIEPPDTNYSGEYLDKYDNSNVKFKGFFRFGKRHGQWMAFYASGLLWSECYYDKGLKHGANNVFYENGKPRYKGWFKNDLRDSLWVFYDESGKEIQKIQFKNDEEVPAK